MGRQKTWGFRGEFSDQWISRPCTSAGAAGELLPSRSQRLQGSGDCLWATIWRLPRVDQ